MTTTENTDSEALAQVRAKRGYVLPVHELLDEVDPEILSRYDALASELLFADEPRALELKTRYLVLVGVATATKGDPDGIIHFARRAVANGASRREVLEAISLAGLPAGMPAIEEATQVLHRVFDES
ncbi:carboxymuconolactone decarboxylase family protein [Lentzea sp. NPDC060358]|uniref:carboxymuconolactone decarboxylase family protein n=1 Tax=Lentzea sp. NPDC060358 TaxID=3347103 RepID=UPI00365D8369